MEKEWTGERLEPFVFNETAIEHLHRYAIAKDLVTDKVVLDIASGEGYGAHLLTPHARQVTGIDIDAETIAKAVKKYRAPNLQFITGSIDSIPFADNSFDVITCFETLEHVADHEKTILELKRVLRPEGIILISTPDKKHYTDIGGFDNPFHKKELYLSEFIDLVGRHFSHSYFLYQRLALASIAVLEEDNRLSHYSGDYENVRNINKFDPVYIIALASDSTIPKPSSSLFHGNAILQSALKEKEAAIKKTMSYRLGNFLLFPFKLIRAIPRKF